MAKGFLSLSQFHLKFGDDLICRKVLHEARWSNGIYCPFCGCEKTYNLTKHYLGYKCSEKSCRKKFSLTTRTIFENSKIPMSEWFLVMYLMSLNKKNVSSRQMALNLGLTQKTTWLVMSKVRELMWQDEIKLSGIVEVDESFLCKGSRWTRWGGVTTRKEPIMGMCERGGKVIIQCMNDRKKDTINELVRNYVEEGAIVYTDGWIGYGTLTQWYIHDYVDHGTNEYVRGDVHTNNIENVWRQLKTSIRHAHHSVGKQNAQYYCDEIAFRINSRNKTPMERFDQLLQRSVLGKSIRSEKIELKIVA